MQSWVKFLKKGLLLIYIFEEVDSNYKKHNKENMHSKICTL